MKNIENINILFLVQVQQYQLFGERNEFQGNEFIPYIPLCRESEPEQENGYQDQERENQKD